MMGEFNGAGPRNSRQKQGSDEAYSAVDLSFVTHSEQVYETPSLWAQAATVNNDGQRPAVGTRRH
jgi:hypothetical protein